MPPVALQRAAVSHLDEVTGKIDAMLATIHQLKALLVERRAALITDVITGRKKVPA
jgi:putative DNA restriction-modification system, specificity subunit